MISDSEKVFVRQSAVEGVRYDGRRLLDLRHLCVETGIYPTANGSSRVTRAYTGAQVLCAVKLQLNELKGATIGGIEVSIDTTTVADSNPSVGLGHGLNLSKQEQDRRSSFLVADLEKMIRCIIKDGDLVPKNALGCKQFAWKVFVDVVVLGSDGNLSDLISLAAYSALTDTKKPKVEILKSENRSLDSGSDFDFDVDPNPYNAEPLVEKLSEKLCIRMTMFELVEGIFVADAAEIEERCALSSFSLIIDKKGNVCGTQILGKKGALGRAHIHKIIVASREIAMELFKLLDRELK
mmetsp:Transcript_1429/g.1839  ORF Transcript_1429/g.1839 Transcript_1429/m.1839 type:complete len:295 (-) Transcript_1429:2032-2916(-)|eukprot:CAMPEP_0204840864 /NCGR_PEP_ID=MMETSP1346-20131115/39306_1 /ASSEMBLY_ACC=CAM_ASM_000771 /TAXON_ID=215587 /ORGANISM="Aplanochytrium stocchinoi, Strain GSBS06" /LENGTH=294 /DNA_ID=CAMNT_0051978531 /DNA_START=258 /DNA_END=1142 /DNA_ORIENTATION=+